MLQAGRCSRSLCHSRMPSRICIRSAITPARCLLTSWANDGSLRVSEALAALESSDAFAEASAPARADRALQAELLTDYLVAGSTALDCGCGPGHFTALMAHLTLSKARVGASEAGGAVGDGGVVGVDRRSSHTDACVPALAKFFEGLGDQGALHRIVMLPLDGTQDLFLPHAPFNAIRVGFALPSQNCQESQNLLAQLRKGGRLIAHIQGREEITVFDKDATGHVSTWQTLEKSALVPGSMQKRLAIEIGADDATGVDGQATGEDAEATRAANDAKRDGLQESLARWRVDFETNKGRKPTRQDLMTDPIAGPLFREFAKVNE